MKRLLLTKAGRNINAATALFQLMTGVVFAVAGARVYLQPVLFIFHAVLAAWAHKEIHRGHREAARDRGDQDPFAGGGTITSVTISGDARGAVAALNAAARGEAGPGVAPTDSTVR